MQELLQDADVNLFQWLFADGAWSRNIPACASCSGFPCESQHQACGVKHTSLSISCIMAFSETGATSIHQILTVSAWNGAESPGISRLDFSSWPLGAGLLALLIETVTGAKSSVCQFWIYILNCCSYLLDCVFYSYTVYFKNIIFFRSTVGLEDTWA